MEKSACALFLCPIFKDGYIRQVKKQSHFFVETDFVYQNQTLLKIYDIDLVIVTFSSFIFLTIIIFIRLHHRFRLHWLCNFGLIQLPREATLDQVAKSTFLPELRLLLELPPLELRVS